MGSADGDRGVDAAAGSGGSWAVSGGWDGAVPADQVVIAEVASSGAVRFAPRTLRLFVSGDDVAVRDLAGRLVWLETETLSAFPDPEGAGGTQVVSHVPDGDGGVLLPVDTAAEVQAMVGVEALQGWFGGRVASSTVPGGAGHEDETTDADLAATAAMTGDRVRRVELLTADRRTCSAIVSVDTGLVISMNGESTKGPFKVSRSHVRVETRTEGHFAAR